MAEPSYDDVPYEGRAIPASAPAALLMTARMHGGPRPPLERARILELGCGDGANLLPLAFHHPDWILTGIDSSERAIAVAE
jgi:methylase of polypeptide subunit release factors